MHTLSFYIVKIKRSVLYTFIRLVLLTNMLEERRANPRKVKSDFFDYVLEELDRGDTILTEAIALDLMFVLLFGNL